MFCHHSQQVVQSSGPCCTVQYIAVQVGDQQSLWVFRLKTSGVVNSPKHVNEAIQDVVGVLMIARPALGIVCSSRGAYAGCVHVREGNGRKWVDCSNVSTAGMTIPGDCSAIERFQFDSKAR